MNPDILIQAIIFSDIDECNENGKLCINGQCENTVGSYRCICDRGFQLSPDGAYCLGKYLVSNEKSLIIVKGNDTDLYKILHTTLKCSL